ncbi:MAG: Nramp family divalent metal transporter [Phycisphaerales bacterium]|nr:Nramp family divalent metal transporter [Phycisphaerales bacterium]
MSATKASSRSLLTLFGPGLLIAATGVGAGDLATAGFAGSKLGTAVLWAVLLGAVMKYVLTEGIARWQVATGQTLVAGVGQRLGRWALWAFLLYLIPWTWIVAAALISATGVATQALLPLPTGDTVGKVIWGSVWSLSCLALVWRGGFRVFERCMAVGILIMVAVVVFTAAMVEIDLPVAFKGLLVPTVPSVEGGRAWTIALIGGVGGTVTMLCYGYWLSQQGRRTPRDIQMCRIDLMAGYLMTAIFGIAMVIIASNIPHLDGSGVGLLVSIADTLGAQIGAWSRWVFLVGGWAAIVSSMLGVWQSVPMILADVIRGALGRPPLQPDSLERTSIARWCLIGIATLPVAQAIMRFEKVQLIYTVIGAYFLPMLAIVLLLLLRRSWTGTMASHWLGRTATMAVLGFFVWVALT